MGSSDSISRSRGAYLGAALWNLLLAMAVFSLCRLVFYLVNRDLYPELPSDRLLRLFRGGLRFDLSAVLYLNLPYLLLTLLPLRLRENRFYRKLTRWLFVIPNFLAAVVNLCDTVYFPFTGARTTWNIFREFEGDNNLAGIFLHEALVHWYLVLLGLGILVLLIKAYREPKAMPAPYRWTDYLIHAAILAAVLYPLVGGLRGGFGVTVRPIGINDASLYIEHPEEAGIVLNTPFSMLRTIDAAPYIEKNWYPDRESLEAVFNPVHVPAPRDSMTRKNVVILILESFSTSYSAYQSALQGMPQPGHMPFLDSLMQESMVFRYSFSSGRMSIDAQPSVLCGIPAMQESFVLSPYSGNRVRGLAAELAGEGYATAFYHGAQRQSLALAGFAHQSGFQAEYSRESYADESDFDGTWGIWDEPFLQYFKRGIDAMPEPFLATVFTLSSHHPYRIPHKYETLLPETELPIHRAVSYSDLALRRFFESASKEPWYNNTLFVLTGDHTNASAVPEYRTASGLFSVPIVFFTPDGSLPKGVREGLAMQMDVKPTVLSYLGYDKPYLSFGCDLLTTPEDETYAFHAHGTRYCYYSKGWQLQFDGEKSIGLYAFEKDHLLEENLLESHPEIAAPMEARLKAVIQQYNYRMIHNEMTAEPAAN